MTRIIDSLADIAPNYDVLLCDLWGCLHNGKVPYPAAVTALQDFRAIGGRVMLLTNAPRPRPSVIAQLDRMGVPRDAWDDITTSGDAAQAAMVEGAVGRRVHHIGPPEHGTFFTDMAEDVAAEAAARPAVERVALTEAEGIVCTGPVDEFADTPEDYRGRLLWAKTNGLKLLCANPDIVVDYGDRRLYCAGAIAQLYTGMGGESLYFGKPHPPVYDLALRRLAHEAPVERSRVLAVGDGIGTDVAGAMGESFDALFVTGGLAAADTDTAPDSGRYSGPDPARLAEFIARHRLDPAFSIGFLR